MIGITTTRIEVPAGPQVAHGLPVEVHHQGAVHHHLRAVSAAAAAVAAGPVGVGKLSYSGIEFVSWRIAASLKLN